MRKLFTTLKSVVAAAVIASMTLAASCSYDDSAIKNDIEQIKSELAALTERVNALESKLTTEVNALKAMFTGEFVTEVKTENGNTTVTLSDGTSFTIYAQVTDTDTNTTVAPYKDADGVYYWAVYQMNEFVKFLEVDGAKVPVFAEANDGCDCVAPELKFSVDETTGNLLVSIDGGATWVDSGISTKEVSGACVFEEVIVNEDGTVTFVLADGSEIVVPMAELISFGITSKVYVAAEQTKEVIFTAGKSVADIQVMNQPTGWSATVELTEAPAEDEGDEVDPGFGILSEGLGAEDVYYYSLKITAPAKQAVDAKAAQKSGDISLHINTNSGTCKVAKLAVNYAEINLSVDKSGNITLTSSLATEQTNYWGEKFVDFADFCIGIMPKAIYDEYINTDGFAEALYYEGGYTQRNSGFGNVMDLAFYEEGVCEVESYEFTVDQLGSMFYPKFVCDAGQEYYIFVATETTLDMTIYELVPVMDSAIVVPYKSTKIDAKLVEGSEQWNDATFTMSLAGYSYFLVGWVSTAEIASYIEWGMCTDVDSFYDMYLKNPMGSGLNTSAGPIVMDGILDTDVKLSELAAAAMQGWAPAVEPNTEYRLFVFPFEMETEMDLYTMTVSHEDVYDFGTFTTKGLVSGSFDAGITYEVYDMTEDFISVAAYFNEEVTMFAYDWFDSAALDAEARAESMLAENYLYAVDELTTCIEAYDSDPTYPLYLGIVVVNGNGEYVYVEKEFALETEEPAEPAVIEFTSAVAVVNSYNYLELTFANADLSVVYKINTTNAATNVKETGFLYEKKYGDTWYGDTDTTTGSIYTITWPGLSPYPYYMDVKVVDGKYDITLIAVDANTNEEHYAHYYGDIEGLGYEGGGATVYDVTAEATLVTDTTFGGYNPYDVLFTFETGETACLRFCTLGANYLAVGDWQANQYQEPNYISLVKFNGSEASILSCNVAYANDEYTVTMSIYEYVGYTTKNFTFTGEIKGLEAPEAVEVSNVIE